MTPSPVRAYHHGDLRNALLATATELARESGPSAVQLREAARRIGVSPSAAYRHFADRADLLSAVAGGILHGFAGRTRAAIAAVPQADDPQLQALEEFRAVGLAYVDYALAEPGLFRTAYASGVVLPGFATHEEVGTETADHPYRILVEALDELTTVGVLPPERRPHAEIAAWAGVHGLAVLVLDGVLGTVEDPRTLIDATLAMIGIGLCTPVDLPAA